MNTTDPEFRKQFLARFNSMQFHNFIGLTDESYDFETGRITFEMKDELVGNRSYNILHGGITAGVLDLLGAFVLIINGAWRMTYSATNKQEFKGGTIDLRVDYLRPGKGKRFTASGHVLRQGNKVAVVRSELRNEQDELIAVGTGTYLIG